MPGTAILDHWTKSETNGNKVIDELVQYIVETAIASSELLLTNVGFVGNSANPLCRSNSEVKHALTGLDRVPACIATRCPRATAFPAGQDSSLDSTVCAPPPCIQWPSPPTQVNTPATTECCPDMLVE